MNKKLVFISHIMEEKELAKILSDEIKKSYLGMLDTFVSSDGQSLPSGGRWLDKIDEALNNSAIQISLCSPQSIKRPWINFEAGASWIRKIPVIPICHSGLKKNSLPIPLAMLQGANIDSEDDLKVMFDELTKILGASSTPNIDYQAILSKSSDFEKKYTYTNVIKDAIYQIINIYPDLNLLFFSGQYQSQVVNIQDYKYNEIVKYLEILKSNNLISYVFNQTEMNRDGTFRGGSIVISSDYDSSQFL